MASRIVTSYFLEHMINCFLTVTGQEAASLFQSIKEIVEYCWIVGLHSLVWKGRIDSGVIRAIKTNFQKFQYRCLPGSTTRSQNFRQSCTFNMRISTVSTGICCRKGLQQLVGIYASRLASSCLLILTLYNGDAHPSHRLPYRTRRDDLANGRNAFWDHNRYNGNPSTKGTDLIACSVDYAWSAATVGVPLVCESRGITQPTVIKGEGILIPAEICLLHTSDAADELLI